MSRRKYREQRHIWLQRELEASGDFLHPPRARRPAPLSASRSFGDIAVPQTVPTKRRRPRSREVSAFN